MPAPRETDAGKDADAEGKVTNYGNALLTESLHIAADYSESLLFNWMLL